MTDERSGMRLSIGKSARREPEGAEPEPASQSRSDPVTSSADTPFISRLDSRQRTADGQYDSGSSYVDLQSLGPSAIRTKLQDLFDELRPETLAGPVSLIGVPIKIGEGGQFYVYKQEVGFLDRQTFDASTVAVKRPLKLKSDPNPDAPIDLADSKVQESLGHIRNEIQALTHPDLRHHPNIVRLLSWAFGEEWDRPFVLVLELAHEDLASALKQKDAPPDFMKVRFCSDIANGLEAIHQAQIVHGDLKPANVLIFRGETRFVAKLADFGFSTDEDTQALGGTPGWQPPETKSSLLGDCFSYGLLVWSVLFLGGEAPPHSTSQSRKDLALAHVDAHRNRYPVLVTERIKTALSGLLEVDMTRRSCRVDDIFDFATEPNHPGLQEAMDRADPHVLYNFAPDSYIWETQPRSAALLNGLYRTTKENSKAAESVAPEDALAISLYFATQAQAKNTDDQHVVQKFLEISARQYDRIAHKDERNAQQKVYHSNIACDLLSRFCKTPGRSFDCEDATKWLEVAVATGSVLARADLRELDPERLSKMLESFRSSGGYNKLYRKITSSPEVLVLPDMDRLAAQVNLHELAAFGTCKELSRCLDEPYDSSINALSASKETALYIACARGSWEHAELLLERGADASIKCTVAGITSLHWIFAFNGETCKVAVKGMLRAGADVNASIPPNVELPFPHCPFVLPAGTPLHWAIATSSHDAIEALIEAGADPLLRNGSDPYMYDDRIRHLYTVGGPDAEGCTFAESGCLGLSSVDLAAVHRDPFLLQLMVKRGDCVDINSADEEGFTVFHRLATSQVFRTSRRVRYPAQMFRGKNETDSLRALIAAIKSLGGDIERLTSSAETAIQKEQRPTDLEKFSYTPLMLAMLEADHSLVQALLTCGASVDTENTSRATALFHISHRANAEQHQLLQCFRTLLAYGANVNHRSSTGNTPLLAAAQGKVRDIFDLFLSLGAHIDERNRTDRAVFPGKSVFASFVSSDEGSDQNLLKLLTTYVFQSSEPERKRRVIQEGSDSGSTLLHECAAFAMPDCVKALLQNGARVNALERKTLCGLQDGKSIERNVWYETPLDCLESTRTFKLNMVKQRNALSLNRSKILQVRWNEVEKHLKSEGGKPWTPGMASE
ncbi:hypothetical protein NX059_002955 [Plenodomus lindquistii]|nr:hypothetical protein NX059_002955 [Plenodomus lindquistii]